MLENFVLVNQTYSIPSFSHTIKGNEATFTLLKTPCPNLSDYDGCDYKVLVEKDAFSCNYRDVGFMSNYFPQKKNPI